MPPKRKRAADDTGKETSTATRTTRSSARQKTSDSTSAELPAQSTKAKAPSKTAAARSKATANNADSDAPKKAKTTSSAKPAKGSANDKATKASSSRGRSSNSHSNADDQPATEKHAARSSTSKSKPSRSLSSIAADGASASAQPEPYSSARSSSLFAAYADPDEPALIGPEGFERLFTDAGVSMEGAAPLILAWLLNAQEMAQITLEQWEGGMKKLGVSNLDALSRILKDIDNLLIFRKPALTKKDVTPYDRGVYDRYAQDVKAAFAQLYGFCFNLAKQGEARVISMDMAVAFWSVLLAPQYPIMNDILEFVNTSESKYRGTKDIWSMTLAFCQDPDSYDEAGAWPTMIDEFVAWKNARDAPTGNSTIAQ